MKHLTLLLTAFFFTIPSFSQITMMEDVPIEEEVLSVYDSLANFKHQEYKKTYNYHHLIGQTVMFCSDPYDSSFGTNLPEGEYFIIEDLLPDDYGAGLYDRLQLKNTKTGVIKAVGGISPKYNRQFVVVGHYEKLKQLFVGKQFIYVGEKGLYDYYRKADHMINVSDGKVTCDIKENSIWTCIDVQVKPRKKDDDMYTDDRSPIVLLFENPEYGKHYCYYEGCYGKPIDTYYDYELPLLCGRFNDKSVSEKRHKEQILAAKARRANMIKKYGEKYGKLVADGKIIIGMTKNMCRDAWGEPDDINRTVLSTGTHEQWVYGMSSYVYFDGDKITGIQN